MRVAEGISQTRDQRLLERRWSAEPKKDVRNLALTYFQCDHWGT
jgi:hypothetical protein